MKWYENTTRQLEVRESYSRKEIVDVLQSERTGLSDSAYNWALNEMLHNGLLYRKGYDEYVLSDGTELPEYQPLYSELALTLIDTITKKYPYVTYTVFETILMNDFLNHLVAQNTIFIQVEKESSIFIFRFLQEQGYSNLMYKPSETDFALYWTKDSIIISDIISEAPVRLDKPHTIMLEKMLVDMCADKLILNTYSKAEFPNIIAQAKSKYRLDKTRMLRYARRRNRERELKECLEGSDMENAVI